MKKLLYGTLVLALVGIAITFSSCEKSDIVTENNFLTEPISKKSRLDSFDYQLINGVSSNTEISKIILNYYKNKFNSDVNYPDRIHTLLDNSSEENFRIAIKNKSLNYDDLIKIKDFCENISYSNTKRAAQKELNNFKKSDYYSSLSSTKKTMITQNLESIYYFGLNNNDKDDITEFEISSECAWAIAAFAAASAGLATLTAATGGLATLAVIASYNIACVQLVQACKKR